MNENVLKKGRNIRNILIIVLILNWLVAVLKLIFGYFIKSQSMVADGFHSFADGSSNVIGLFGIWLASRPRDEDHPYGHNKYETFTAIVISIMLFLVCFNILHGSWGRFHDPVLTRVDMGSFLVMVFTIIVNIWVMNYEYRAGKRLNSDILVSDSLHTRSDVLTSFSVIIALVATKLGYPILDPIAAVVIAFFIAFAGVDILRHCSKVLCDTAVVCEKRIEDICLEIAGVIKCHKIRTRGREDDIYVDLHVLVKNDMHIDKAHELSYKIEDAIKRKIPGVTDVVVHMEPLKSRDQEI
jgi:cation diffusion facilitator family transporter